MSQTHNFAHSSYTYTHSSHQVDQSEATWQQCAYIVIACTNQWTNRCGKCKAVLGPASHVWSTWPAQLAKRFDLQVCVITRPMVLFMYTVADQWYCLCTLLPFTNLLLSCDMHIQLPIGQAWWCYCSAGEPREPRKGGWLDWWWYHVSSVLVQPIHLALHNS